MDKDLKKRIEAVNREYQELLRECVEVVGLDYEKFIKKSIPQSRLFMVEIIQMIHRLYEYLPINIEKSVLDVGPQTFAGTALLEELHNADTYSKLKLKVSAVDIHDKFTLIKELIAPNVNFIRSDIFDLERKWDFIICSHVIEHVKNPINFLKKLQNISIDFVVVACPWEEKELTNGHINIINKRLVRSMGARDLRIYTNYMWGKHREVCMFWVEGKAS